jgi:L-alanine-DL-glutamate epimerase-like enolase superfamily enzyme
MKIKEIKTFVIDCFRTNWVFVKVMTDEGIYGIGEGTLEYKENALAGAVKDIEHALVGKDPFDTEWIWHENYRQLPPEDFKKALKCVEKVKEATKNITSDHWLRHYAGTLTNVRPPDSVKYYHG